jgi:hypothetical protein
MTRRDDLVARAVHIMWPLVMHLHYFPRGVRLHLRLSCRYLNQDALRWSISDRRAHGM